MRYAGPDWATGSVLARAFLRRGTDLAHAIAPVPGVLIAAQTAILAFEIFSPVVFILRNRARYVAVGFLYLFHWMTIATITISFLPQQVALASFLPLERAVAALRTVRRRTR